MNINFQNQDVVVVAKIIERVNLIYMWIFTSYIDHILIYIQFKFKRRNPALETGYGNWIIHDAIKKIYKIVVRYLITHLFYI